MEFDLLIIAMVASSLFFGWTIGSHYTGATMGMAYGTGIVKNPLVATSLIAIFVILGATFDSHNVTRTVGTGIIRGEDMTPLGAMVMMLTAALVTAVNTWMRWPISTSQLACCSVAGTAVAMGAPVFWSKTMIPLCITWVGTPIMSLVLGYLITKMTDGVMKNRAETAHKILGYALLAACCYSAYTLGANNTGNAVGVFFGLNLTTPMKAGFIGGIVMAIGALTWGRPILERVGGGLVKGGLVELDLSMGVGATAGQSLTAHTAALLGYPTSMNQALIGGVGGAGGARGLKTIDLKGLQQIVVSWFLSPIVAGVVSFVIYSVLAYNLKIH